VDLCAIQLETLAVIASRGLELLEAVRSGHRVDSATRRAALLIGVGVGIGSPSAFRVSRSGGSTAAFGAIVLRLRCPGMGAGYGLLLSRLRIAPSFYAHDDEDQQNNDGDDAEGSAHCGPSLAPEDTLERA
jgi:hypothetical protein